MSKKQNWYYSYNEESNPKKLEHDSLKIAWAEVVKNSYGGVYIISMDQSRNRSDWHQSYSYSEYGHFPYGVLLELIEAHAPEAADIS